MNTVSASAPYALKNGFSPAVRLSFRDIEAANQAHHDKTTEQSKKDQRNHYLTYYSKKAINAFSTALGTIPRGVKKGVENTTAALGILRDFVTAEIMFNKPVDLKPLAEAIKALVFPFGSRSSSISTAFFSVSSTIEKSALGKRLMVSFAEVSDDLASAVSHEIKQEIQAAKFTAKSMIAGTFMGPQRREMQDLTSRFGEKNALGKLLLRGQFEREAAKILLEYNGVVYSKDDKAHAISFEKLAEICEKSTGRSFVEPGNSRILIFKEATEAYTLDSSRQPSFGLGSCRLQPASSPAPRI